MIRELPVGRALRRFRRLNGMKQSHAAELLNVSQGSVSRWESGKHEPEPDVRDRIATLIAAHADSRTDAALKRLIETSTLPVHLVCDATHQLLVASPARAAGWRADVNTYLGVSLWPYASPEIVAAEATLPESGWFDRPFQCLTFATGTNDSDMIVVRAGVMRWETIPLANGRVGRLTTAVS